MVAHDFSVVVIGSGPGGYATAIRAARQGLKTAIVESDAVGGTCLNVGCIPSKALLHGAEKYASMVHAQSGADVMGISVESPRIDYAKTHEWIGSVVDRLSNGVGKLLSAAGAQQIFGWASLLDPHVVAVESTMGDAVRITAEHVVVATGSVPVELEALPFSPHVLSSTDALALKAVPERLSVLGGGYIGLELGTAFAKLGARVTVIEAEPRILPGFDERLVQPVARNLERLGVSVLPGHAAIRPGREPGAIVVRDATGSEFEIPGDLVLVAVGRAPRVEGWGLESLGLDRVGRFIKVDHQCRTSMPNIFAVGDVTGEPMLAHRAIAQGEMVADLLAGRAHQWDKVGVPSIVFTDPEIVCVGLTPDAARAAGVDVLESTFPFSASGRAIACAAPEGFVRVVARAVDHALVGVQAVGSSISELSAAFTLALEMGARLEDVAATIHTHPTRSEGFQEACMRALGESIHI